MGRNYRWQCDDCLSLGLIYRSKYGKDSTALNDVKRGKCAGKYLKDQKRKEITFVCDSNTHGHISGDGYDLVEKRTTLKNHDRPSKEKNLKKGKKHPSWSEGAKKEVENITEGEEEKKSKVIKNAESNNSSLEYCCIRVSDLNQIVSEVAALQKKMESLNLIIEKIDILGEVVDYFNDRLKDFKKTILMDARTLVVFVSIFFYAIVLIFLNSI